MRHHGEDTNTLLSALSLAGGGLAAGALVAAAPAQATVLVNTYHDVNIGFGSHATTGFFAVSFSHEPVFGIVGSLGTTSAFNDFRATIAAVTSSINVLTEARPVPRGATQPFNSSHNVGTGWATDFAVINARSIGGDTLPNPVPHGNQYYLLTVLGEFFGWFSGSLVNTSSQVYFHLNQAALDTTPGVLLPAGAGVPEPSSLGLLALAAMATGAAATRRYKRGLTQAKVQIGAVAEGGTG
jgi:hypothetical protein